MSRLLRSQKDARPLLKGLMTISSSSPARTRGRWRASPLRWHARRYREAGADALFVEAPQSEAEIRAIANAFPHVPLLFNYAEGGKTPAVDHATLAKLGFSIVTFPISAMLAATRSMRGVLARIKQDGSPINVVAELPPFNDFLDFTGLPEVWQLEQRYGDRRPEDHERPPRAAN
jgi:hypothetical protein